MKEDFCKYCGGLELEEVLTPEGHHYGKLVCTDCDRFVKWISDPNVMSHKDKCKLALSQADKSSFIEKLRRDFEKKGTLSPRQLECVEENVKKTMPIFKCDFCLKILPLTHKVTTIEDDNICYKCENYRGN